VVARPIDLTDTPPAVWSARLEDGAVVVGVFNWGDGPINRTVNLADIGLATDATYRVQDLWEPGTDMTASGSYTVQLGPRSAALPRFSANPG
jgi:hypothetical protein